MANSTSGGALAVGKRKDNNDDRVTETYIPLPIQNFLLTQTCFFIQPSQPNSNAAREGACLTFERVLVQNILHGLSPTFCEAIQSISRWQLIRVAFPHVMHCTAVMLQDKILDCQSDAIEGSAGSNEAKMPPSKKFEASETKLLYTLHWIILDAASECEDNDSGKDADKEGNLYLHDLTSIQLFVYLFAPLVAHLQESDFHSLKLELGLRIWSPMLNYQHPDVACFSAPVKPKQRSYYGGSRTGRGSTTGGDDTDDLLGGGRGGGLGSSGRRGGGPLSGVSGVMVPHRQVQHTNTAHIYLGKGSSMEKLAGAMGNRGCVAPPPGGGSIDVESYTQSQTGGRPDNAFHPGFSVTTMSSGPGGDTLAPEYNAPLARLSDICPLSTLSGETVSLEVYCEKCNTIVANKQGEVFGCRCKGGSGSKRDSWSFMDPRLKKLNLPVDLDYKQRLVEKTASTTQHESPDNPDLISASHFDLAVLRCLFCPKWDEEGVYWAIRYLHKRLLEIRTEMARERQIERPRSKSVPLPDTPVGEDTLFAPFGEGSSCGSLDRSPNISADNSVSDVRQGSHQYERNGASYSRGNKKFKRTDLKEKFNRLSKLKRIESAERNDDRLMELVGKLRSQSSGAYGGPSGSNQGGSGGAGGRWSVSGDRRRGEKGTGLVMEEDEDESDEEIMEDRCRDHRNSSGSGVATAALVSHHSRPHRSRSKTVGAKVAKEGISSGLLRPDAGVVSRSSFVGMRGSVVEAGSGKGSVKPTIRVTEPPQLSGMGLVSTGSHSALHNGGAGHQSSSIANTTIIGTGSSNDELDDLSSLHETQGLLSGVGESGGSDEELSVTPGLPPHAHELASLLCQVRGRENSVLSQKSLHSQASTIPFTLHRSFTDSNIAYRVAEQMDEVAGSVHYIQPNGHLNYYMVLKALFWVSKFKATPRVCEYIMHNLACLIDLNIFEKKISKTRQSSNPQGHNHNAGNQDKTGKQDQKKTPESDRSTFRQHHYTKSGTATNQHHIYHSRHNTPGGPAGGGPAALYAKRRHSSRQSLKKKGSFGADGNNGLGGGASGTASAAVRNRLLATAAASTGNSSLSCRGDRRSSTLFGTGGILSEPLSADDPNGWEDEGGSPPPDNFRPPPLLTPTWTPSQEPQDKRFSVSPGVGLGGPGAAERKTAREDTGRLSHCLAMDTVIRVIRALGCSHGHGASSSDTGGVDTNAIRSQTHNCLLRLYHLHPTHFRRYLVLMAAHQPLTDIVDVLHAFTGFCLDPAAHTSPKLGIFSDTKSSYRNSFGQSISGEGTRGAEGVAINCLLPRFIRRLVESRKEVQSQENMALFSDIRQLLVFLREVHGSTFRRALLAALMHAVKKRMNRSGAGDSHRGSEQAPNSALNQLLPSIDLGTVRKRKRQPISAGGSDAEDHLASESNNSSRNASISHNLTTHKSRTFIKKSSAGAASRYHGGKRTSSSSQPSGPMEKRSSSPYLAVSDSEMLIIDRLHASSHPSKRKKNSEHVILEPATQIASRPGHLVLSGKTSAEAPVPGESKGKHTRGGSFGAAGSSPRSSVSEKDGEESHSGSGTPKTRIYSRFTSLTRRQNKSSDAGDDDSVPESYRSEPESISNKDLEALSPSHASVRSKKKMSFRMAGQATLSFLSVRRRVEETIKTSKRMSITSRSKKQEDAVLQKLSPTESEATNHPKPKQRRPVDVPAVKRGVTEFSFLLECFEPGCVPEPQLIAALLDLEAPVVSRACLLLECAHFVHRCNRGEWPAWMKFNLPGSFRHSSAFPGKGSTGGFGGPGGGFSSSRRTVHMQRMAGRMFHAWAEALGSRLEYFLRIEQATDRFANITEINDEGRRRELQLQDQEENFLDDSTVNESGESCPYALKAVAIQLLFEITTYLRETHQYLPKAKLKTDHGRDSVWERQTHGNTTGGNVTSFGTRRPSAVVSISANSPVSEEHSSPTSSVGDMPYHQEHSYVSNRRISFAFIPEKNGDSQNSSTNSLDQLDGEGEKKRFLSPSDDPLARSARRSTGGKNFLRKRRGSGSLKRAASTTQGSFRQQRRESTIRPGPMPARMGSVRIRKASAQSTVINMQGIIDEGASGELPGGRGSVGEVFGETENTGGGGDDCVLDTDSCATYMPWINVVTHFANRTNFVCEHQSYCHPNCYERQQRQCRRLLMAVKKIMSWEEGADDEAYGHHGNDTADLDASMHLLLNRNVSETDEKKLSLFSKARRKESTFPTAHSPHRRRESTPLFDKIRHDIPLLKSRTPAGAGNDDGIGMSLGAGLGGAGDRRDNDGMGTDGSGNKKPQEYPTIRYIENQVHNLTQCCFSVVNKAALLLNEEHFSDLMPVAWELLLENDQELTASAATVVLLSAIKTPELVQGLLFKELQHDDVHQRMNAILRFRTLWSYRYQVWPRLEENAQTQLKLPPPYIEFVLPSPTLGHPGTDVPDPAWSVRKAQSAEEVQLKQNEAAKTFVTASTTRRKQQQLMLERALASEKQRQKLARQNFHLRTCSVLDRASVEAKFTKDHKDEGMDEAPSTSAPIQEEFNAAVRRLSVAPINRSMNAQTRNLSWRHGSISWFRAVAGTHQDEEGGTSGTTSIFPSQPLQMAQCVFPSSIGAAAVSIIHLLDDFDVNSDGIAVGTVAEYVVWRCLVEDCALFLRYILERLTRATKKDELIYVVRKLIQRMPELPTQAAHTMFNNLVGYIMFYVRTPTFSAPESIAGALSILWMVVPYVQNIYFKDLKQILRKEQVDPTLLVTTNLPCAKQFNVFDDDIFVAQLVRLQDENKDYRFSDILTEALESSNIPEEEHDMFFLCDDRSNIIRNSSHYVRDFYFFKRNHTPKLRLKKMEPGAGHALLQKNAFNLKFLEIGKIMFTFSILQNTSSSQMNNHVYFLHEELSKLPSFPRKALESEFTLYDGEMGRQLYGMDMLHKLVWVRTVALLFDKMSPTFPWSSDIHLFLNVYNGTLILHSEDTAMLRVCLASYIQACQNFKLVFSVNGYLVIMASLIRVYDASRHNEVSCKAIEFVCKQFFVLHRTPFILQMFGAIANHVDLESEESQTASNFYKIRPSSLYKILQAIATDVPDKINILGLLSSNKPLKAMDFCYQEDDNSWSILESVNLCVTVIAYAPESYRAKQMMVILRAILPFILRDLQSICQQEQGGGSDTKKTEIQAIQQLSIAIKQLLSTTDWMLRLADRTIITRGMDTEKASFRTATTNHTQANASVYMDEKDDSPFKRMEEGRFRKNTGVSNIGLGIGRDPMSGTCKEPGPAAPGGYQTGEDGVLKGIIKPREAILHVACDFLTACHKRLTDLGEKQRAAELLDNKSHMRLSEIAQSIIKQIPSDTALLKSKALLRYFMEVPPLVDWGQESMRSCKALETLIYRLNRTMAKIFKDSVSRRHLDWDSATILIKSVYITIQKNKNIGQLKEVKSLLDYLKKLILMDPSTATMNDSLSSVQFSGRHEPASPSHLGAGTIPPKFSSSFIKLLALMLQALGNSYKLRDVCERGVGDSPRFGIFDGGNENLANYLVNIVIPLLLRCGVGRKDAPPLSDDNIYYGLRCLLNAMSPHPTGAPTANANTTSMGAAGSYLSPGNATGAGVSGIGLGSSLVGRPLSNLSSGVAHGGSFYGGGGSGVGSGGSGGQIPGGLSGLIGITATGVKVHHLSVMEAQNRSGSVSHSEKSFRLGSDYVYRLGFIGLKVMMICYPRHIMARSRRICNVITDMGLKKTGGIHLWKFLDFLVTYRPPLFVTLLPFIKFKMSQIRCDTQGEQAFQQILNQKMMGLHLPSPRSDAAVLKDLAADLRTIREELQGTPGGLGGAPVGGGVISPTSTGPSLQGVPEIDVDGGGGGGRQGVGGSMGVLPSLTMSESFGSTAAVSSCQMSSPGHGMMTGPPVSPTHSATGELTGVAFARNAISRNSSKRIISKDGNKILNRFQQNRPEPIMPVPSVDSLPSQTTGDGVEEVNEADPTHHRLQRSDAKSRKTTKLRRTRTATLRNRGGLGCPNKTNNNAIPSGGTHHHHHAHSNHHGNQMTSSVAEAANQMKLYRDIAGGFLGDQGGGPLGPGNVPAASATAATGLCYVVGGKTGFGGMVGAPSGEEMIEMGLAKNASLAARLQDKGGAGEGAANKSKRLPDSAAEADTCLGSSDSEESSFGPPDSVQHPHHPRPLQQPVQRRYIQRSRSEDRAVGADDCFYVGGGGVASGGPAAGGTVKGRLRARQYVSRTSRLLDSPILSGNESSEEALLAACGAALAESESSNTSASELSSLIKGSTYV